MLLNAGGHLVRVLYTLTATKFLIIKGADNFGDGVLTARRCFNNSVIIEIEEQACSSSWKIHLCDARTSNSSMLFAAGEYTTCSDPGLETGDVVGIKYRLCSVEKAVSYFESFCTKSQHSTSVSLDYLEGVFFWFKLVLLITSSTSVIITLALYAWLGCGDQERIKIFISSIVALAFGYSVEIISICTKSLQDLTRRGNTNCKWIEGLGMYFTMVFLNWTVVHSHFLYSHRKGWLGYKFRHWMYLAFCWVTASFPPALWILAVEYENNGNCGHIKFSVNIYLILAHTGCLVLMNFYCSLKCNSRTSQLKNILKPSGIAWTLAVLLTQLPFTGVETILYVFTTTDATSTWLEVWFESWFAVQGLVFCVRYCFTSEYVKHKVRKYFYQRKIIQGLPPKRRRRIFTTSTSRLTRSTGVEDIPLELQTINTANFVENDTIAITVLGLLGTDEE